MRRSSVGGFTLRAVEQLGRIAISRFEATPWGVEAATPRASMRRSHTTGAWSNPHPTPAVILSETDCPHLRRILSCFQHFIIFLFTKSQDHVILFFRVPRREFDVSEMTLRPAL
jgi:hypothetical protein